MNHKNEFKKRFALFRCMPNSKMPATPNGYKDAKFNCNVDEMIKGGYNIGLACRLSHVIVIDVDVGKGKKGFEELNYLESIYGKLLHTLTQVTQSGGIHLFYSDEGIINPKGKLLTSIDIKWNGYVLCAPSTINGNHYKFTGEVNKMGELTISRLPKKWLELINRENCKHYENAKSVAGHYVRISQIMQNCDCSKIINKCKFLQYCKDNAETLIEPMWFSMISVLAQISDSDQLIHELSKPYPRYSSRETQRKIDRARSFGHSQSCSYISGNYPECCKGCEEKKEKNND